MGLVGGDIDGVPKTVEDVLQRRFIHAKRPAADCIRPGVFVTAGGQGRGGETEETQSRKECYSKECR